MTSISSADAAISNFLPSSTFLSSMASSTSAVENVGSFVAILARQDVYSKHSESRYGS